MGKADKILDETANSTSETIQVIQELNTVINPGGAPSCPSSVGDHFKLALGTVGTLGEAVGPFLPLIAAVTTLTAQIVKAYENAQYNKKSCAALIQRVQAAEVAVQALNRRKQENEKNFRNQNYYFHFERFVATLRDIKGYIQDVTILSGYRKFISSGAIKERFQQLKDVNILQEDIEEMTKFLQKIEGGVTTIDKKISNVLEHILTLKGKSFEKDFNPTIKHIQPNELIDPPNNPTSSTRNKQVKIQKKRYRGLDVACKVIVFPTEENNKSDSSLYFTIKAIFENLKFYSTFRALQDDTTNIGNITQIVRWLAPEKMNSKKLNQHISAVSNPQSQPSKKDDAKKDKNKDDDYVPYTIQCEIFSFGMLLWELAFQKFPYKDWEISRIQEHVLKGEREMLHFPLSQYGQIEKKFGNIIKAAWQQDPSLRPELNYLFNDLEQLSAPLPILSPGLIAKKTSEEDIKPIETKHRESSSYESFDLPSTPDFDLDQIVMPMMKLEDGITAHKNGDKKKAYECFKNHSDIGNKVAKYWLGYYYWEGYVVKKSPGKGAELFKEAADKGVPDAQLRYAFALSDKNSPLTFNLDEFVKYLSMAADNGNTAAQFNLGDLFYNGKLGVPKEPQKGLSYLKLAAIKGQPKARAMLDKLDINYYVQDDESDYKSSNPMLPSDSRARLTLEI
ncbi:13330_t:CDS:2 [Funneliformis mosseae]|uniref:13330_t:CDS:1 n=1 Tax=Funneliformis mosseae TaxID=27381 RepID=A0A9N9H4J1_FUNMO|nr:13330_t:CDS:2 [Funneliformis mosseae]